LRLGFDVAMLAEEAHADVVPQLRRVGRLHRCHAVLDQRDVHVLVGGDEGGVRGWRGGGEEW
jgi:hypothetical protein